MRGSASSPTKLRGLSTVEGNEGQGELYSPLYATKITDDHNQPKSTAEGDEGQGKLYSPEHAVKIKDNDAVLHDNDQVGRTLCVS